MNEFDTVFPNLSDSLGDWRLRAATRLAADIPAAYPGGPSHKTGAAVHLSTSADMPNGQSLGFFTPDSSALALNVAIRSAVLGKELRDSLKTVNVATPKGTGKSIAPHSTAELFDFFEAGMQVVTFSFQSLESFSNLRISEALQGGTYPWRRTRKAVEEPLSSTELERAASTDDKVGTILPALMKVVSPKGSTLWNSFLELKELRDATIHLKARDQYPHLDQAEDSLQFKILRIDLLSLPKNVIGMMNHFVTDETKPRWLGGAELAIAEAEKKAA